MDHRLQQFLSAENISQSQFADKLGVARASVSHILSGRNKPGFDFIESMSRIYPSLNLEWLITGKGKMYKEAFQPASELFQMPSERQSSPIGTTEYTTDGTLFPDSAEASAPAPASPSASTPKHLEKIIAFYSDGTFQELK